MCDPNIISQSAINKFKLLNTTSCTGIHKKFPWGDFGINQRMGALVNRSQRAITVATFRRAVMASDSRVMLNYRGSKSIRKLFPLCVGVKGVSSRC
jgi:hypothetical protein